MLKKYIKNTLLRRLLIILTVPLFLPVMFALFMLQYIFQGIAVFCVRLINAFLKVVLAVYALTLDLTVRLARKIPIFFDRLAYAVKDCWSDKPEPDEFIYGQGRKGNF